MTVLVIPAAGRSERYGLSRPKFLLHHPQGGTMLTWAISGFGNMSDWGITSIRIVTLKAFFQDLSAQKFTEEISEKYGLPVEIDLLDAPTSSMVETLSVSLSKMGEDVSIIVKDCDNIASFSCAPDKAGTNFISFVDLEKFPQVTPHNKSFVSFGSDHVLDGIVEKRIIGSKINIGCVRFDKTSDFLAATMLLKSTGEVFVSDVIRVMIQNGKTFQGIEADYYEDWGTLEEWRRYTKTFGTLFVDVDGVLATNENPLGDKYDWNSFRPIEKNIESLLKLAQSRRVEIIFTTARSEKHRTRLEAEIVSSGFEDFRLLMGLQHSKRYLINDFSQTNPYPSANSVNIPRNADNLSEYLEEFF